MKESIKSIAAGVGVVLFIALIVVGMVACSKAPADVTDTPDAVVYNVNGGYIAAYEFRLKDGTRCVAVGGNTGRGVDCEWKTVTGGVE